MMSRGQSHHSRSTGAGAETRTNAGASAGAELGIGSNRLRCGHAMTIYV